MNNNNYYNKCDVIYFINIFNIISNLNYIYLLFLEYNKEENTTKC